ncbi:MAG TPA: transglycosylase SLT domain-containing protein, partial [Thermoanaerobaculia bacterium]
DLIGRILENDPSKASDPVFRYLRAKSLFASRNYERVVAVTTPREDPYYLDTQILRARAYWRTDRNQEFLKILNSIVTEHPKAKQVPAAKVLLAKYSFTDEPDYDKAAKTLQEAIDLGALGEQGENLWTLGWIHTLAHDDEKALAAFEKYLEAYPDADYTSNVLFWSGKVQLRNGRTAERDRAFARLLEMYPFSYYSYRARQIAGIAPSHDTDNPYQFPEGIGSPDPAVGLIEELLAVGMETEAAREAKKLAATRPDDRALASRLADLYARAGEPLKAIVILQRNFRDIIRHGGRGVPQRFWEILYPRAYWNDVQEAATRRQLNPYLLASIIRQESGYDPNVVSNAGAVGLMQIMPNEITRIAERGALPPMTRADLFDPAKNIEAGAAEVVQKLEAMEGDHIFAIAAYNAGEQAVGRWLAIDANRDVDLFIESIPFNETRLYVKSVLRNQYEYMRIYENSWSIADKEQRQLFAPSENR